MCNLFCKPYNGQSQHLQTCIMRTDDSAAGTYNKISSPIICVTGKQKETMPDFRHICTIVCDAFKCTAFVCMQDMHAAQLSKKTGNVLINVAEMYCKLIRRVQLHRQTKAWIYAMCVYALCRISSTQSEHCDMLRRSGIYQQVSRLLCAYIYACPLSVLLHTNAQGIRSCYRIA